ncbi:transcriptional regulator GcvA [Herbaspirillum sp. WKF16]|jgi:LysR family glycine cleavage system transcriptional activator|uniref:transcriptional regulator GcvA n=1 Tax=Herbaspirillum sp. WKF16 TaxID=3028312 RepID=UPI0023A9E399|nr:transcriptional regulator GcvA [Herbaspirillum sp. WKF16]WDZ96426.1 transcriptional regulator GcvA [Herbaspirillum sp. WKF16]
MAARKLPSLNALRAFEASARHCSFTLAAQELHVTQGAVSHQVKALEEELGLPLFERQANQLRLTRAGQQYIEAVRDAFDRIERATAQLLQPEGRPRLAISASPNFAAKWLAPRLGGFAARHPGLELRLEQSERHANFIRDDIDVAVRYGLGPWPGLECLRLGDEFLLPVCAPSLAVPATPGELAALPLLHVDGRDAWAAWFAAQGRAAPAAAGIVFNHESAAIDAAVSGQGVTLARASLVSLALRQGLLVAPLPPSAPLAQAYWLAWPQERAGDAKVDMFAQWLRESFELDRQFWSARASA